MPDLTWSSKTPPEPAADAALEQDSIIYPHGAGYPHIQPEDRLILGDNLRVMSALLPEYEGRINLIYADPPFFTNRRYSARVGRGEDSRHPEEWRLAEGYPDHWPDIESYLDMLYPRLTLMHRLLSPTGSLYLHLDWHANHYARLLLDEIFGSQNLLNEIIWVYHGPSAIRRAFNRKHDTILVYTKSDRYTFNADAVRAPYNPNTVKTFGSSPKAGFGKIPNLERGKIPEDWWYFPVVARLHSERTGYPTQKPEALLERIVLASSSPGDLVADFFCGAGTMAVAAARSGRRFIANDISWRAIHTIRSRLIGCTNQPFSLQREKHTKLNRLTLEDGEVSGVESPREDPHSTNLLKSLMVRRTHIWGVPEDQSLTQTPHYSISLGDDLLPDLDYWEIDPAWNGEVFKSAAQALRPRGKQPINLQLEFPANSAGDTICIRLVRINGDQNQIRRTI